MMTNIMSLDLLETLTRQIDLLTNFFIIIEVIRYDLELLGLYESDVT